MFVPMNYIPWLVINLDELLHAAHHHPSADVDTFITSRWMTYGMQINYITINSLLFDDKYRCFTHVLSDKHWSNDCPSASEAILKNKYITWIHWELQWTLPKQSTKPCKLSGVYCSLWISNIQPRNMLHDMYILCGNPCKKPNAISRLLTVSPSLCIQIAEHALQLCSHTNIDATKSTIYRALVVYDMHLIVSCKIRIRPTSLSRCKHM